MKKFILIILTVLLISTVSLLGGSMIWVLDGANGLDINGTSGMTGRPDLDDGFGEGIKGQFT